MKQVFFSGERKENYVGKEKLNETQSARLVLFNPTTTSKMKGVRGKGGKR